MLAAATACCCSNGFCPKLERVLLVLFLVLRMPVNGAPAGFPEAPVDFDDDALWLLEEEDVEVMA
jgi:hypothetical protein